MEGTKISKLAPVTEITGNEEFPIAAGGKNYKVTIDQIREGLATKEDVNIKQDKLPTVGNIGDILIKSKDGVEWKANPADSLEFATDEDVENAIREVESENNYY